MTSNETDTCLGSIGADPDIAGVGIRISVYVTTVLLSLLAAFTGKAGADGIKHATALIATAGLQGLTLLITAIVQTATRQLSLYHAFVIFHLLAFLGFQLIPSYFRSTPDGNQDIHSLAIRTYTAAFTQILATAAYMSWMIYLMVTAPTFGPADLQPCNNRVLYVFFFKTFHATDKWIRIVAALFGALPLQITFPVLGPILTSVYGIVTLELMIHRNAALIEDEAEKEWGFGQVLAMVLLVGPFKEIMDGLLSVLDNGKELEHPGFARSVLRVLPLLRSFKSENGRQASASSSSTQIQDIAMQKIPGTP